MAWLWPLLAAPFVGSLLGVLIARVPIGAPVLWARSRCDHCGHVLAVQELAPLLSFVALRGRCRRCRAGISPFHWQVELAAILVPASAALAGMHGPALWAACVAGWLLLALAWIDAQTLLLPDALTLPLAISGLLATFWLARFALLDHALAALLAYFLLREAAVFYRWLRGRDGFGGGDPKLLGAIGAWVGLADLPLVLLGAALAGLGWALLLRLRGDRIGLATAVPFGPFLALSGWAVLLAGGWT